jgi:hypothetical protein
MHRCDDATTRGSAVLLTLVVAGLLAALGLALLTNALVERQIAANQSRDTTLVYAADAMAARATSELALVGDWTTMPGGSSVSSFHDETPVGAWREPIDVTGLTEALQQQTNSTMPRGADTPRWRVYASGSLHRLLFDDDEGSSPYLVTWVADDPAEEDGDPGVDANESLLLHVTALDIGGLRRDLDLEVRRRPGPTGGIELVTSRSAAD